MKQSPRNTVLKPSEQIRRTSLQVILSEVQSPNHALKASFRTGYGQRLMRTSYVLYCLLRKELDFVSKRPVRE